MKHMPTIAIALLLAVVALLVANAVQLRRMRERAQGQDTSRVLPPPLATTPIAPPTNSPLNELRKRHQQAASVVLPIPYADK